MTPEVPPRHLRARAALLGVVVPIALLFVFVAANFVVMLPHPAGWLLPLLAPAGVLAGYASIGRTRDGLKQVVRCYFYVFGALVALFLLFRPEADRGTALAALAGYFGGLAIGLGQAAWDLYRTGPAATSDRLIDRIVP